MIVESVTFYHRLTILLISVDMQSWWQSFINGISSFTYSSSDQTYKQKNKQTLPFTADYYWAAFLSIEIQLKRSYVYSANSVTVAFCPQPIKLLAAKQKEMNIFSYG